MFEVYLRKSGVTFSKTQQQRHESPPACFTVGFMSSTKKCADHRFFCIVKHYPLFFPSKVAPIGRQLFIFSKKPPIKTLLHIYLTFIPPNSKWYPFLCFFGLKFIYLLSMGFFGPLVLTNNFLCLFFHCILKKTDIFITLLFDTLSSRCFPPPGCCCFSALITPFLMPF